MKLTQARYEAFARLGDEIDSRIERACKLYNTLLKDAGVPMSDDVMWHNGKVWLDDLHSGLDIRWETSWQYGGHDSGSYFIPMKCIIDDTWEEEVTRCANKVIISCDADKCAKEKRYNHEERQEFNRLKAIFEGDES